MTSVCYQCCCSKANARCLTCNLPLGLDVALKIRFYKGSPLLDAAFYVSASVFDITNDLLDFSISCEASPHSFCDHQRSPLTSSRETEVRIFLCKDFHIQDVQDTLIIEGEDAFENKDMWRIHETSLVLTLMLFEGVDRNFCTSTERWMSQWVSMMSPEGLLTLASGLSTAPGEDQSQ